MAGRGEQVLHNPERLAVKGELNDAIAINPDGVVEKVYDACDWVVVDTQLTLEIKSGVQGVQGVIKLLQLFLCTPQQEEQIVHASPEHVG